LYPIKSGNRIKEKGKPVARRDQDQADQRKQKYPGENSPKSMEGLQFIQREITKREKKFKEGFRGKKAGGE